MARPLEGIMWADTIFVSLNKRKKTEKLQLLQAAQKTLYLSRSLKLPLSESCF
jgi:hypothetical protein